MDFKTAMQILNRFQSSYDRLYEDIMLLPGTKAKLAAFKAINENSAEAMKIIIEFEREENNGDY